MTIKIGDLVRLKSGGPKMTVKSLGQYSQMSPHEGAFAACTWFQGSDLREEDFALETLEIYPEQGPPRVVRM